MPVTTPLELTVATSVLSLLQVKYVAESSGLSVAVSVYFCFTPIFISVLLISTLSGAGFTSTSQVAVFPLEVFTVITAVPTSLPVTTPLELTVATALLLLLQVQYVAESAGASVAVSVHFCFTPIFIDVLLIVTLSGAGFTSTSQVAVFPLEVFTVITAVPTSLPVTTPLELTVATALSLLLQVQYVAESAGVSVAVSVHFCFTPIFIEVLLIATLSGAGFTSTSQVAVFPFAVFTVIVAFPTAFPVTLPFEVNAAISFLLDFHVKVVSASSGSVVAAKV